MSEVPKLSQADLLSEVVRLNVVLTEENRAEHPLTQLGELMRAEHPLLQSWGAHLSGNLNRALGQPDELYTPERMSFDNGFTAAYGLIRAGYEKAGQPLTLAPILTDAEPFLEPRRSVGLSELFAELNQRQNRLADDYPEFLEAAQEYARNRMPGHGRGFTVGAVAIAAAEVYYGFCELEFTARNA